MILLPDQQILVRKVCDALHEAAASVPSNGNKPPLGWTETICRAVFDRLDKEEEGIECAFGSMPGSNPHGYANRLKFDHVRGFVCEFSVTTPLSYSIRNGCP